MKNVVKVESKLGVVTRGKVKDKDIDKTILELLEPFDDEDMVRVTVEDETGLACSNLLKVKRIRATVKV